MVNTAGGRFTCFIDNITNIGDEWLQVIGRFLYHFVAYMPVMCFYMYFPLIY